MCITVIINHVFISFSTEQMRDLSYTHLHYSSVFLFCDLIRKLESNWQVIRDEGLSVLDKKSGGFIPEEENLREQGDWKQFTLYQRGRKSEAACQKTPQTCAIIDTMRDATGCKRGQVRT